MADNDWHSQIEAIIADFAKASALAGNPIAVDDIHLEFLDAPHRPKGLPANMRAVYIFRHGDTVLKVGQANENSGPRYVSQHYDPKRAKSSLANSMLISGDYPVDEYSIGEFIKSNCDRVNVMISTKHSKLLLTHLEVFIQCRLNPKFEGRMKKNDP